MTRVIVLIARKNELKNEGNILNEKLKERGKTNSVHKRRNKRRENGDMDEATTLERNEDTQHTKGK